MNTYDEMTQNAMIMRKVKRAYNWISGFYVALIGFYFLITLVWSFLKADPHLMLDSIIFKSTLILCGVFSCYKHNNKFIILIIINQFLSLVFEDFVNEYNLINEIIPTALIPVCIITIIANKKYAFLSQQYGFPYFNVRNSQQEEERMQYSIKSKYQQNLERIVKNHKSDDMSDIASDEVVPSNDNSFKSESIAANEINDRMDSLDF